MNFKERIYEKFFSKLKNSEYVGVEIELPIINLKKPFIIEKNIIQDLFQIFLELDFVINDIDNEKNVISIKNPNNGDTISLEYSYNTIELSLNKELSIYELEKKFLRYYKYIQSWLKKKHYKLCDTGINPNYRIIDKKCLNQDRYNVIERLLTNNVNDKLYSQFCAYCCSIQTHINVSKENLVNVFNTFTKIEDIKDNIFANSYMIETNLSNSRKFLWENSNFGPNNVGKNKIYLSIEDILDDYLNRNLFFVERNNEFLLLNKKIKLYEYFKNSKIRVVDKNNKEVTVKPHIEDIENFRSYKSVELTKYGTLEIRTDCTQKIDKIFKLVAFNLGVSMSSREILNYLESNKNITKEKLIEYAIDGLKKRGKKEEVYLEDL